MSAQPTLHIDNVSFEYGDRLVLENVNFSINERDFVAVIGPNGGGTSTLLKLIMGLLKPKSGTIKLFGDSVFLGRSHVGYLSQFSNIDLNYPISVIDVVLMSRLVKSMFYRLTAADYKLACEMLDRVGIVHLKDRPIARLSGGEKQRVFLARALLNNPKLLILDEPTTSIDATSEQEFYAMLKQLNAEMGILLISHDISAVSVMVDKIACLNRKLVYHDNKELTSEDLNHTYGCEVDLIAHGVPHRVLKKHD